MRDTIFKPRQYGNIFPGTGHHLGGKKAPSRLLPSTEWARDGGHYKETSDRPTLAVDTFLSRLPQSVVRKGKIIDVRNGVQNMLRVSWKGYNLLGILKISIIRTKMVPIGVACVFF